MCIRDRDRITLRAKSLDVLHVVGNPNRVGIGLADPQEALDVDGNVKADNFIGDGSQLTGIVGDGYEANTDNQDLSFSNNMLSLTNDATTVDLSIYDTYHDISVIAVDGSLFDRFETGREHDGLTCTDITCLLYTSPSPRDRTRSRMPSSA